ncbi:MAG TPA: hypothetical protein VNX21_03900 [Candidatus Thermoplasmatota archaeon]|nr:hypothetical protein [Candidatus Thermoplasmatota archaeon]
MKAALLLALLALAFSPTAAAHDETEGPTYCDPGDVSLGCYTCSSTESSTDDDGVYHDHCTSAPRICNVQVVLCLYLSEVADLIGMDIGGSRA